MGAALPVRAVLCVILAFALTDRLGSAWELTEAAEAVSALRQAGTSLESGSPSSSSPSSSSSSPALLAEASLSGAAALAGLEETTSSDPTARRELEALASSGPSPADRAELFFRRRQGVQVVGDRVFLLPPPAPTPSTRNIFLITAFSHDDLSQWPLMGHFITHYRDRIGIDPKHMMIILHSDHQNVTGLTRLAKRLRRRYGVGYLIPDIQPYTSQSHMVLKHSVIAQFVKRTDWVFQVDADEFAYLPQGLQAEELIARLEGNGNNIIYGYMIDQLAPDGSIDLVPAVTKSLFEQYPLVCAVTTMLQRSDPRKVTAYRGYLRTTAGNHDVIGCSGGDSAVCSEDQVKDVEQWLGPAFETFPLNGNHLFTISPPDTVVTLRHFKWVAGLSQKLVRRRQTEAYTTWFYELIINSLHWESEKGVSFPDDIIKRLCQPQISYRSGASAWLSSEELINLFFNIKQATVDEMAENAGLHTKEERDGHFGKIFQRLMQSTVTRDYSIPTADRVS
ncbi:unnamed protein product [Polarella glacialis]|uniref:Glycosyltransferase family 92 protein n=1 Tax=Polarella glacialis TaxID=89957 RepID=A0A813ISG4_POLGL|nr:unnamed protein product [Polarella glacialis]